MHVSEKLEKCSFRDGYLTNEQTQAQEQTHEANFSKICKETSPGLFLLLISGHESALDFVIRECKKIHMVRKRYVYGRQNGTAES